MSTTLNSTTRIEQKDVESFYGDGFIYITCACGNPLMVWPNVNLKPSELVHHVPLTDKCKKYKALIQPTLFEYDFENQDIFNV